METKVDKKDGQTNNRNRHRQRHRYKRSQTHGRLEFEIGWTNKQDRKTLVEKEKILFLCIQTNKQKENSQMQKETERKTERETQTERETKETRSTKVGDRVIPRDLAENYTL